MPGVNLDSKIYSKAKFIGHLFMSIYRASVEMRTNSENKIEYWEPVICIAGTENLDANQ